MYENYAQQSLSGKLTGLRNRVSMSQGQVAQSLNVSLTTVCNWETGTVTSPNAKNLQKVIALYLQKGGFTAGKEQEEAEQLWAESQVRARFDDEWFHQQLATVVEQQTVVSQTDVPLTQNEETPPTDAKLPTWERQRVLEISSSWIQSCLAQTLLQNTVRLQLQLRFLSDDVVASPKSHMFDVELPERVISSSDIMNVYDEMGGTVLILGEPGSGKTFLLLELARTLLRRADKNERDPIPVVLDLSSWAQKHLPLTQWMVEALNERYQIPRELGTAWVESELLLPLFDSLDEVPAPLRPACIAAINDFRRQHGLLPLVVCSRSSDYLAQEQRLLLRGGIEILPLTMPQIEYHLAQTAPQSNRDTFDVIYTSIQDDTKLQELLFTPLMLNVVTKVYRELPLDDLLHADTLETVRQKIFACYVDSMSNYRNQQGLKGYQPSHMRRWLAWLAQQMEQRGQSEFYLEHMQIDWLPPGRLSRYLPIVGVGCVYALFLSIIKGVNYAFLQGADQHGRPFGPVRGLVDGLVIGASCLFTFVVLNGLLLHSQQHGDEQHRWQRHLLENRIVHGAIIGLVIGVVIAIRVDVPAGIYNGLFCAAVFTIVGPLDRQIKPAEALFWSWPMMQRKLLRFVVLGTIIGVAYGLFTAIYWQLSQAAPVPAFSRFLTCILFGLSVGLILGLFVLIIQSTSHRMMDKPNKPNQGIWNSARNSLLLGGGSWLLFGIFLGIAYGVLLPLIFHLFAISYSEYNRYFPNATGVLFGLMNGLGIAALFWARNGGTACIQHFVLRLLLWQANCTPWRYTRFLDYTAERVLLRKTGGGYIFIHVLLLKYFCSCENRDKKCV